MDMNTSNENLNTPQGARPLGFGYADSVSGRVEMCTWDRLNSAVDSPRVAAVCADLRQLKATRDSGGMTHADYEVRKSRLKKQLPVIMPHAAFPSGHRKNSEAVPSGLAMYDADHIGSPHDYWQHKVLAACDGQPARLGIVLAHITPSYEGLRLIFRIPHGMTPAAAQQWMATRLGDDTYDASVKDYARCSFVVPRGYFFFFPGEETVWGPDAAGHDAGAEDALKVNEPLPPGTPPPLPGGGFNHFLGHFDCVIGHVHVLVEVNIEFGGEGHFVGEGVVLVVEVDFLNLHGEWLAKDVNFVLAEVVDYGVEHLFVEYVALHLFAETAAELLERNVARTETGNLAGAAYLFEFFVDFGQVVVFGHLNFDKSFEGGGLFESYLHDN